MDKKQKALLSLAVLSALSTLQTQLESDNGLINSINSLLLDSSDEEMLLWIGEQRKDEPVIEQLSELEILIRFLTEAEFKCKSLSGSVSVFWKL